MTFRKLNNEKLFKIEKEIAKKYMQFEKKINNSSLPEVKDGFRAEQEAYTEGFLHAMILTGCFEEERIVRDFLHDFEIDVVEGEDLFDEKGELKEKYLLDW